MSNNTIEKGVFIDIDIPTININTLQQNPNILKKNYINNIDHMDHTKGTHSISMNKPIIEFNQVILEDYAINILPFESSTPKDSTTLIRLDDSTTPDESTTPDVSTTPNDSNVPDFIYVNNLCSNNIEEQFSNCLYYLENIINCCTDIVSNVFNDVFKQHSTHQI